MGDLALGVGCMDAQPVSGARGAQLRAMCALQQGWVLYGRVEATHRNVNWRSSCRSMHHERGVDLALEDLQIGVDEPPKKTPRAEI